ncbi:MAG: hypothetical protein IJZ46_03035 [Bacilli bacterium]|nr:hypothetical protein [Bacilli bacterium]
MKYTFLENQKNIAKKNYNYFITCMIYKVLFLSFKLSFVLILNQIFNFLIFNVLCILYVLFIIYSIYKVIVNYNFLLKDIRNTLNLDYISFELDLNFSFIKKVFTYGK